MTHTTIFQLNHFLIALALLGCIACESVLNIQPDKQSGLVVASSQFENDASANDAVAGLYYNLYSKATFNRDIAYNASVSSDELYPTAMLGDESKNQLVNNSILPTNQTLTATWTESYAIIENANSIIENVTKSTGISANKKKQLIGEAKFIRAFCHFYLVNIFGKVPLITTTDYKSNSQLGRTPVAEVYQQIVLDLAEAEEFLPMTYPTQERVRANKAAAQAMLARVYLYLQDWGKAEQKATDLLTNTQYSLESDLNTAFLNKSQEAILQFWTKLGYTSYEAWVQNIRFNSVSFGVTEEFISSFEVDDQRKAAFLDTVTLTSAFYTYPAKYNIQYQEAGSPIREYEMVLRLGEQYLIRAEARAQQGKTAEAVQDINRIRERAGLEGISESLGKDDLLLAIEQERRAELCFEWGHRWFDLKRTKRADVVLGAIKPSWKPTAVLYPIPQSEIRVNIKLTQNPGY